MRGGRINVAKAAQGEAEAGVTNRSPAGESPSLAGFAVAHCGQPAQFYCVECDLALCKLHEECPECGTDEFVENLAT